MARGWIDHQELAIIMGVAPAPGDAFSVEDSIQTLNLMSPNSGVALVDWTPQIPTLEQGGIWSDSPLSIGRRLLVGNEGNVTEKMQLTITAPSLNGMLKLKSDIGTLMQSARAFWTDNAQIQPVFIKWWVVNAPGPQYALIYNMDMVYDDGDSPTPSSTATLTIEREPYWRFLPPGANPKQWTYEYNNQPYNYTKANLLDTDSLYYSTALKNRSEFTSTAFTTLLTDNAIVIPAAKVPGDAPALFEMFSAGTKSNFIFGLKTRKITQSSTPGATPVYAQNNIINAADGTLGTDATINADTGASIRASTGTANRVQISFATATNALRWTNVTVGNSGSSNRFIGRWMVFMRCRQSAGALGDITMYLRYGSAIALDTDGIKLNVVYPPVIAPAGNSTVWGLVYMGVITSPLNPTKAHVNLGNTVQGNEGLSGVPPQNLTLGLFALRSAGAGVLYINDLILIPIDEGSLTIELGDGSFTATQNFYDETGYLQHGLTDPIVINGTSGGNQLMKLTGPGIQLQPNVENRIYPLNYDNTSQSAVDDTIIFGINIIPRCRGIRNK